MPFYTVRQKFGKITFRLASALSLTLIAILLWKALADATAAYDWHWNRIWRYVGSYGPDGFMAGPIIKGLVVTLEITVAGLVFSILCGLLSSLLRLSPWPLCVLISKTYVTLIRSTPLLLQLFIAYFLISPALNLSPLPTAISALALFEGAFFAEIFRSGILSVHKNQWEAALSLGFSLQSAFFLVILPQTVRNILPSLGNQAIALLKDSTLVSAIAVADLTMQSQAIVAESFLAFETWLLAGAIYLVLALFISLPAMWLEKTQRVKQRARKI